MKTEKLMMSFPSNRERTFYHALALTVPYRTDFELVLEEIDHDFPPQEATDRGQYALEGFLREEWDELVRPAFDKAEESELQLHEFVEHPNFEAMAKAIIQHRDNDEVMVPAEAFRSGDTIRFIDGDCIVESIRIFKQFVELFTHDRRRYTFANDIELTKVIDRNERK